MRPVQKAAAQLARSGGVTIATAGDRELAGDVEVFLDDDPGALCFVTIDSYDGMSYLDEAGVRALITALTATLPVPAVAHRAPQAKDIAITRVLAAIDWQSWEDSPSGRPVTAADGPRPVNRWEILPLAAPGFPEKVLLAKLRSATRSRLITGCACGCRGDFVLTPAGRLVLDEAGIPPAPTWETKAPGHQPG